MKLKMIIMAILCFCMLNVVNAAELPKVTDHEKVKVYVFWRDGCRYCEKLIEALNEEEEKYLDYIEIVTASVYDGTNGNLYDYISNVLGDSGYVPYTVIGDEHVSGFDLDKIIDTALKAYQNDNYVDTLGEYINQTGGYTLKDLEYACDAKGIEYWNKTEKDHSVDGYIVAGIFVVVIAGLGYLIFSPKKINNQKV